MHKRLENLSQYGNKEIGPRSEKIDLGGCRLSSAIFGAGVTTAHFQISGTFPSLIEPLNIAAIGSAISGKLPQYQTRKA